MRKFANALYPGQEEVTVQLHCNVPTWLNQNGIDLYARRLDQYADNCHKELQALGVIAGSSSVMIHRNEMHCRLTVVCKEPQHHEQIRTQLSKKLSEAFHGIECVPLEQELFF